MGQDQQSIVLKNLFNLTTLNKLSWQPFRQGVQVIRIYGEPGQGPAAALLKYDSGAGFPWHEHTGYEHILVLANSQSDSSGDHQVGTLVINLPDSRHRVVAPSGAIVLVIWEKPIRLITDD